MTHRPRSFAIVILLTAGWLFFAGCATSPTNTRPAPPAPPAPVVLISLDGFRWDYCDLHPAETPNLRALRDAGARVDALIPVFPSNTFPNHYSLVTGLRPARSGMINNTFYDTALGEFFRYNHSASVGDPRWWGGEPIWVTAVKQGRTSATAFWVGSEAPIGGVRPTWWQKYDYSIPFERRLDELLGWLRLPPAERPTVIAFYLEETNSVGHRKGPDSPELAAAVKLLDDRVGQIVARARAENLALNLVVVSDHGMANVKRDEVLVLDDYFDLATTQIDFDETCVGLRPLPGADVESLLARARKIPNVDVYTPETMPARYHITPGPRIPPVWIVPREGFNLLARAKLDRYLASRGLDPGNHGWDPALPSMHGILIASGPAFRAGARAPAAENIHVYNLLCAAAGLKPAPNDGDDRLVRTLIAR